MEQSFFRRYGALILAAVISAAAYWLLYDDVSPAASINFAYTRTEILGQADRFLKSLGYNVSAYQQDANFQFDGSSQLFFQSRRGTKTANQMIRADSLSTHNWTIDYYDRSLNPSQFKESFRLWMSPNGRVIGFTHVINDTASRKSFSQEEARRKVEAFLAERGVKLSNYSLKTSSSTQRPRRLDHRFEWADKDSTYNGTIWVQTLGTEIGGFRLNLEPSSEFRRDLSQSASNWTFLYTASFVAMFLLFFFIVILFLKKYHEGEVGTKTAFLVFAGLYAAFLLNSVNMFPTVGSGVTMGDLNRYYTRFMMFGMTAFIFYVFLSVMAFAAWSVGESSSRSAWPQKMAAFDGALYRKFFTLDLAESIVQGYAWGLILLGVYTAIIYVANRFFDVGIYAREAGSVGEAYLPALRPIIIGIAIALFCEIVFRLFFITYLKEKTKKIWLGVLVSTAIWTLSAFVMWDLPHGFLRLPYTFAAFFVFGLAFSYLFLKYDLFTAFVANFLLTALLDAGPLFTSTNPDLIRASWMFLGLLCIPPAIAAVGFARRERFEFTKESVPAHILRISERERMAKELEIARRVQMSLLPKASPTAAGYDIAGTCIPALEVGGDYYDFVNLGGRKIGIAIGDVSGKGVPAAIYMTLTKGILQSHAEENISPKKVLEKVNGLMYRTIDRNSFVSMFYAILDVDNRKIRFARAGQCPVIVAQRNNERGSFITPKGMALGLEVGKVFDSVLEEQELDLHSGEVLVFYTDGFTEAMNETGDEFGEIRLVEAISRHRTKPANDIIQAICSDLDDFTKGWQQHDDMTMVVVKVG
ncbi:MAG: SpoIIE family protein phosphatase [Ignavibacteriae bacterium]|nr:SpoIIE family protein phosphatase [Ignavibacteriota bacterium]